VISQWNAKLPVHNKTKKKICREIKNKRCTSLLQHKLPVVRSLSQSIYKIRYSTHFNISLTSLSQSIHKILILLSQLAVNGAS